MTKSVNEQVDKRVKEQVKMKVEEKVNEKINETKLEAVQNIMKTFSLSLKCLFLSYYI